jgi:hypothetical protein
MSQATEGRDGRIDWRHHLGPILWSAFLVACLATMLFFACFDPLSLLHDSALSNRITDRLGGYTVGFFFFWAITTLAAGLTAWLIATQRNEEPRG